MRDFYHKVLFFIIYDDFIRDWRVARHETSLEDKENSRSNGKHREEGQDLRNKIRDRG